MTRSSLKRMNRAALEIALCVPVSLADRRRSSDGSFDEASSRALARHLKLDIEREINWALVAEKLNCLTAVEWL